MQLFHAIRTDFRVQFVMRYRRVIGVFFLVIGLLLSIGEGVEYASYQQPLLQKTVVSIPTPTPVIPRHPIPLVHVATVANTVFGPSLPVTPSVTITPTITIISQPTITPIPKPTSMPIRTPTPTMQVITTVPTAPTITLMPTIIITPTVLPVIPNTDDAVWDKLAHCESTENWRIDTGNGYFGGLQFSQGTWESVGGTGSPAQASREEQIIRGKLLQAKRGWGAWGGCAKQLGLQ